MLEVRLLGDPVLRQRAEGGGAVNQCEGVAIPQSGESPLK